MMHEHTARRSHSTPFEAEDVEIYMISSHVHLLLQAPFGLQGVKVEWPRLTSQELRHLEHSRNAGKGWHLKMWLRRHLCTSG